MIEEEIDEEYIDDPIRLFDCEQIRVLCCPVRKEHDVEDVTYEGNIRLREYRLNYEETVNSYKNNSSILPVTFFDIESNVELLNQCRPLSIKLVDYSRFPWYHNWKKKVVDSSNLNLNKSDLQEVDCIEILASDTNDDDDTVYKQITSKDSLNTNDNKKLSKVSFVSKNDTISERHLTRKMFSKDVIDSYQNSKVKDLKIGKRITKIEDPQENIVIETKSDSKTKLISENQLNYKELDVDKMNTFACIIDKAYKKLTRDIEKSYKEIKTENTSNKSKTNRLDDYTKINCSHLDKVVQNKADGIICNNKYELLKSKTFLNDKNQTSEKYKENNVFIQEMEVLESIIEKNNDSSSPLLPCPSKIKKNDQMNRIKIISDTPFPSNTQHKIKKTVCKDQLFSAKRVIPHYHYESMYATQICKPFNYQPNISKKTNNKTGSLQKNIGRVTCEVNNKKRGLSKECNQNKRSKFAETDLNKINNITHNKHPISNDHMASLNHVMSLCNKQCYAQVGLSPKQTGCNLNEGDSRNLENVRYNSISSLDATQGNKNRPMSVSNSIPILLDRQSKQVQHNITPKFPIQRVVSNRCNSHTNDLTFQTSNILVANDHPYQNLYHRSNHHNDSYDLEQSLNNITNGTKTVTVYEDNPLSASFYTIPLTPISLLPENSRISSTQFQNINNYENNIRTENVERQTKILNSQSNLNVNRKAIIATVISKESDVNQKANSAVENATHTTEREVRKYPHLKQCLERPPCLINNPTKMNREKRTSLNNIASRNLDKMSNKGYSPPILPIPTYQKTFEILAKIRLYDFDRGFIQPDLSDNGIPSSENFNILEKTAHKRKINDVQKVSRNITLDDYKKRMSDESARR
ncbi:MATH and LRR domain-containing protein PFE0570w-like [Vanessa atalanta]|uniref:MATH and LRR domain-containing protein PFE0570w-like n=1 Tax=Vanessa atalanta TaxID=42275 RepID=UPI001FCE0C3B|nr:MATH and LRR domain-containing protein PFE0570w-like [Vanessa atalanta]XP_047532409.1 MATH and LRR domain-containing protein PFE0570w-like [Vanessa atalanta]XP_047532410.1 MATH and LRR domain-containing protein PFE0570w-like [Vanessa atalanta]